MRGDFIKYNNEIITNDNVKAGYGFVPNGIVEKNLYFYHPDHLGSSSYITDREGSIIQHTEYIAFGETFVDEHFTSVKQPYLFNGKELDTETGLYYYGARYYDPKVSIFLNVDPLVKEERYFDDEDLISNGGGIFNPLNYGVYSYTYNNPIMLTDPDGKCPNCLTALGGAVIGGIAGGIIEGGIQLYQNGKITNWSAVGGSVLQGAIVGGAAGFTGGASLATTVVSAAGANIVGGIANRAVQGKKTTGKDIAVDATVGAVTGSIGYGINKLLTASTTNSQIKNKVTNYLLNKNHSIGKSKAEWFDKALGFALNNSDDLIKQIKFDPKKAIFQKNNGYGDLYQTINTIKGANGREIDVRFNWIIKDGTKEAELVGALPTKQSK